MRPITDAPMFARSAGTPLFGKRTLRVETSVSPITKQQFAETAKACGFANIGEWAHAVLVHEVERKHVEIITSAQNSSDSYIVNPAHKRIAKRKAREAFVGQVSA